MFDQFFLPAVKFFFFFCPSVIRLVYLCCQKKKKRKRKCYIVKMTKLKYKHDRIFIIKLVLKSCCTSLSFKKHICDIIYQLIYIIVNFPWKQLGVPTVYTTDHQQRDLCHLFCLWCLFNSLCLLPPPKLNFCIRP